MRIGIASAATTPAGGRPEATRRVVEIELRRRLRACEVLALTPSGLPDPLDGGRPVERLPTSAAAIAALSTRLDCVVALDGDLDPALEAALPVVRAAAGPALALLLPRRLGPELIRRRAEFLRLTGWAWPPGRVLTVAGGAAEAGAIGDLAAALLPRVEAGEIHAQLAATAPGRGEEEYAAALEKALNGRCRRLPGVAAVEDLVALVAGSEAVLGPPGLAQPVATALGIPWAATPAPGAGGAAALAALLAPGAAPAEPEAELERAEAALARLVDRVVATLGAPAVDPAALEELRHAHEARGLRLNAERRTFAAERVAAVAGLEAQLADSRAEANRLRAELAAARAANDAIVGSRTWRYSQPVRDTLARVRERRG